MKEDFWQFCERVTKEIENWPEEKKAFMGLKTNWPSSRQPLQYDGIPPDFLSE